MNKKNWVNWLYIFCFLIGSKNGIDKVRKAMFGFIRIIRKHKRSDERMWINTIMDLNAVAASFMFLLLCSFSFDAFLRKRYFGCATVSSRWKIKNECGDSSVSLHSIFVLLTQCKHITTSFGAATQLAISQISNLDNHGKPTRRCA